VSETGLTRREALKRGALIAGAAWAIPVVQAVGLRPAYAQTTSTECHVYCIRWNQAAGGKWQHMPDGQLHCPTGALDGVGTCVEDTVVDLNEITGVITIMLPSFCKFETGDPSPDPMVANVVYVKCSGTSSDYLVPLGDATNPLVLEPCPGEVIDQVDLIIKCCCG